MRRRSPVVFDSFALLSFLRKEAGAARVRRLLQDVQDEKITGYLPIVNLAEVYYVVARRQGQEVADTVYESLHDWGVRVPPVDSRLVLDAARLKAGNALSLADAFCVATAQSVDGVVVTGDPEITRLAGVRVLDLMA